jgi:hypothetical protein
MPEAKTYRLIAYDIGTGKEVLNWPIIVDTERPAPGRIIDDDRWRVIGVRTNTSDLYEIDVQKT